KIKRPAAFAAGRPVDCLGLTKRWSLYVASHGDSGFVFATTWPTFARRNSILTSPVVCGL
ncbi:MAG TPA: hypothetical protein VGG14_15140, partial [Candidatus Sulfotelmatobacter sp.]